MFYFFIKTAKNRACVFVFCFGVERGTPRPDDVNAAINKENTVMEPFLLRLLSYVSKGSKMLELWVITHRGMHSSTTFSVSTILVYLRGEAWSLITLLAPFLTLSLECNLQRLIIFFIAFDFHNSRLNLAVDSEIMKRV